ncbi:gliding motility ABC transporter [Leptospira interrogans]|uniref:GldG family protein n=1 Tax=Leptospira interrogans TaxID=173 RepID=UPI0010C035F0|nr:GldG family protein [Leptospira interrogans]QCO40817.1 gliding motility ABC transporter [Leptospira interrogans]
MISKIRTLLIRFNSNPLFLVSQAFLIFLFLNLIVSKFNCKKDFSRSGRFETSESTRRVFQKLHSPLYIDAYYSSKIPVEYKVRLDITKELLNEIASLGNKNVILRFYDPSESVEIEKKAIETGITPQILEKKERGSSQIKQVFLGMTLTLGTEKKTIPFAFYAEELEYQILTTLRKMIRKPEDVKIGILSLPESLSTVFSGFENGKDTIGIFTDQILKEEYGIVPEIHIEEEEIPDSIGTLLWIGGGTLSEISSYRLDQFLMRGGNLILLFKSMDFRLAPSNRKNGIGIDSISPGIAKPTSYIEEQNRIFEYYGFRVNTDLVLDPNHSLPISSLTEVEPGIIGKYAYPLWILVGSSDQMLSEVSQFTSPFQNLLLPWISSLTLFPDKQPKVKMETILSSSEEAEIRSSVIAIGEKQILANPIQSGGKKIALGATLEGSFKSRFDSIPKTFKQSNSFLKQTLEGKTTKILVIGSPYLVSDLLALPETRKIYQESNIPFLLNSLNISEGDTDLIEIRGKKSAFLKLNPFSETEKNIFNFINIFGIPALLGLYTFLRIQRRNSPKNKNFLP